MRFRLRAEDGSSGTRRRESYMVEYLYPGTDLWENPGRWQPVGQVYRHAVSGLWWADYEFFPATTEEGRKFDTSDYYKDRAAAFEWACYEFYRHHIEDAVERIEEASVDVPAADPG